MTNKRKKRNDVIKGGVGIRILQIAVGAYKGSSGGIEFWVANNIKYMNPRFRVDCLTANYQSFEMYRSEIEKNGGELYCLNLVNRKGIFGKIKYINKLIEFLRVHDYDIVHIHAGDIVFAFLNILTFKLVKIKRNSKIVLHSHSSKSVSYHYYKKNLYLLLKPIISIFSADYFFADSLAAGEYMFSRKVLIGDRFLVLKAAIECDKYAFNESIREEYRNMFHIADELVFIHVGRFVEVKNHLFIIDMFFEIHKKNSKTKLLLIGEGPLLKMIKEKVSSSGLSDSIIFAGLRDDVNHCLQAADVFLFPSLYEGFGIVALEAQATGLPVLASDKIPFEANITSLFNYMPLSASAEAWATKALELGESCGCRRDISEEIISAGFEIKSSVKELERKYCEIMRRK